MTTVPVLTINETFALWSCGKIYMCATFAIRITSYSHHCIYVHAHIHDHGIAYHPTGLLQLQLGHAEAARTTYHHLQQLTRQAEASTASQLELLLRHFNGCYQFMMQNYAGASCG